MSLLPTLLGSTSGGGGGSSGSVSGVILSPVVAASTTALTVTYANGSSGVGATLTNAGAQAAISLDGISPTVGQRVLIKNQASALQNGIYTVTVVGTGATNWVLSRATDFDQAAEMSAGTQVDVSGGSTQAATIWILTASVATVGTNNVSFSQTSSAAQTVTGRFLGVQVFKAGATYTPTSGTTNVLVKAWGAGGGGGTSNGATYGSGGGGGQYVEAFFANSASVTIVIGAGGAGGIKNNGTASGNGASTTFNSTTLVAAGGTGAGSAGGGPGAGGTGGTVPAGGFSMVGGLGGGNTTSPGFGLSTTPPAGGSSFGNLPPQGYPTASINGVANSGQGGAGGNLSIDAMAGGSGLMLIYEFS